jgi:hypothetical protein
LFRHVTVLGSRFGVLLIKQRRLSALFSDRWIHPACEA